MCFLMESIIIQFIIHKSLFLNNSIGHSSGGHLAMMAVLHNACGMIEIPDVKGVILESASSDILICSSEPLPPWMSVRPSTVLLGVDSIEVSLRQ